MVTLKNKKKKVLDNVKNYVIKNTLNERPSSLKEISKSPRDYLTTKWCNSRFGERYERDSKNLSLYLNS